MIEAVVFDVGETLVDETREYGTWADWLGVPRHTFSAVFGAVIALGLDYREAFQYVRPGFSLDRERVRRAEAGQPETFGEADLYPDVRPCLAALREMGIWVGVAGNQTERAGAILRGLGLPADLIATSDDWGVSKPDGAFFAALIKASPCPADSSSAGVTVAYVRISWRRAPGRDSCDTRTHAVKVALPMSSAATRSAYPVRSSVISSMTSPLPATNCRTDGRRSQRG